MIDTSNAQTAVRAARRRNLPVPEGIDVAATFLQVVVDAGHEPHPERPTAADIPGTTEELRQLLEDQAAAKRRAESLRAVAAEYVDPVGQNYNGLVRACVPGWILSLTPQFDNLVAAVRSQSRKLPANLDKQFLDWNDPRITAAWEKAESAAHQLDQLVSDRRDMARCIGVDGARDSDLHTIMRIPEPTRDAVMAHDMRDRIGPFLRGWRELKGQPVSRWLYLVRADKDFKISLATPGEVEDRAAAMEQWRNGVSAFMHPVGGRKAVEASVEHALRAA